MSASFLEEDKQRRTVMFTDLSPDGGSSFIGDGGSCGLTPGGGSAGISGDGGGSCLHGGGSKV